MSSEWPVAFLDDVAEVFTGFPFKGADYLSAGEGVRVVRGDNVTEHSLRWGEKEKCWANVTAELQPYRLAVGDVVIGMDGSKVGKNFAAVTAVDGECLLAQRVARVRAKPQFDQSFLQYSICNSLFTAYVRAVHTGTSIPHISKGQIERFQIFFPPLHHQRRIGVLLKLLDDRIALLREANATLEAIAQAMFKSWFIDFDPVQAKQQGRIPEGMDEVIAALFPEGFESSSEQVLPKGWNLTNLASATSNSGGSIQTGPFGSQLHASDYVVDGIPVVMPKDIQGRRVCVDSIARTTQENVQRLNRHKLQVGDIVFSRRGDVERHALITENETGWLCGTGCLLVRPGANWPSPTFLSMLLDASQARTWLVQHAVGATMPNINTGILGSVPVVVPPFAVLHAFEQIASSLEARRSENLSTAQTLVALRDTLLPRLISGQLRLPESEFLIDEVAA